MKRIGAIHTFEDRAFLNGITKASLAVLAGGVLAAVAWYFAVSALGRFAGVVLAPFELTVPLGALGARIMGLDPGSAHVNAVWWVSLVAVIVLSLAVHELIHAFFFRQYAPAGSRVTFGANLKMGMLYASAEGIVYTRQQYLTIALAPSIVVTLLLVAVGIGLKWPLWTIIVATAHLSGCTGDWGYVRAILRDPSITHCEDTSWGVEFYGDDAAATEDDCAPGLEVVPGAAGTGAETGATEVPANILTDTEETDVSDESEVSEAASFTVVDGGKRA